MSVATNRTLTASFRPHETIADVKYEVHRQAPAMYPINKLRLYYNGGQYAGMNHGQGVELRNDQAVGEVFPFDRGDNEHTVQMLLLEEGADSDDMI